MLGSNFKITPEVEKKDYGKFVIEPLDQGHGQTLGNALRRTLLTSLPGAAITQIKINRVKHQFSVLPGLKEDIVELILNIKKIRVKYFGEDKAKMTLSVQGPKEITAKDFVTPPEIEIANKDLYIGNFQDKKAKLEMEAVVEKGFGYQTTEEKKSQTIGTISIDALFSPIVRVNYRVEATRVGRMTNLDKLILEIWTDGTILPQDALKKAAKNLVSFFSQIYDPKPMIEPEEPSLIPIALQGDNVLKLTVEELDLPTRIANCLKNTGIETVKDLIQTAKTDLTKIKNLGGKSISIIENKLKEKDLTLKE